MHITTIALASSELGVSSFTVNSIFLVATTVLLALPMFFLLRNRNGNALSKF